MLRSWFRASPSPAGQPVAASREPIALVCVRHHEDAVRRRSPGDRVYLVREHGNPYDADAIVVVDVDRTTLGLIGRDSWVHRVLLHQARGCTAQISQITRSASGLLHVSIVVELSGSPIGVRAYRGDRKQPTAMPREAIARLAPADR
ncbi:MAG: HIRAN domain-containing protein [Hyphomicrobiaceae bacterium]